MSWAATATPSGAGARATRRFSTPTSSASRSTWPGSSTWRSTTPSASASRASSTSSRSRRSRPSTSTTSTSPAGSPSCRTFGLEKHLKFNIETNHATLAGHSFQHEIEVAASQGMLGSIDANAGDPLLGWDTDQFNTDVKEITLAMISILRAGGLGKGGLNFDAKLRRPSIDPEDLFYAHIGGMDTYALAFKIARQDPRRRTSRRVPCGPLLELRLGLRKADREGRRGIPGTGEAGPDEARANPCRRAGARSTWRTSSTAT